MPAVPYRVEKPWGYEVWWARTDRYVGKQIHINKGHALSLQYHNRKDETIFVWSGRILFEREVGGTLVATEIQDLPQRLPALPRVPRGRARIESRSSPDGRLW